MLRRQGWAEWKDDHTHLRNALRPDRPATTTPPSPPSGPPCGRSSSDGGRSSSRSTPTRCGRCSAARRSRRGRTGWSTAGTPSTGVEQQLPLTEPARGHALHGLVGWLDFVAVDRVRQQRDASPRRSRRRPAIRTASRSTVAFALDEDGPAHDGDRHQHRAERGAVGHRTASVPRRRRRPRRRLDADACPPRPC